MLASSSAAAAQFDLFPTTPSPPLVGTTVVVDWWPEPCTCGIRLAIVGSSAGPHENRLICASCTRHRGWLSAARAALLLSTQNRG
jgi:hypothetical protein